MTNELEDKWKYTLNGKCWYCEKKIEIEDVKDQKLISSCPYCHKSFVD
jgi:hypothetical protein